MFSKEDEQLMNDSRKTLQNLKTVSEKTNKTLFENYQEHKADHGKHFFEEYDELAWENKAKIDMLFYEQLLQKLKDDYSDFANEKIGKLYKSINEIYQFINIKPEIYGKKVTKEILGESTETTHRKMSKLIYEYLDRHFYSLSPQQRKEKYENVIHEEAGELIRQHVAPKEAISASAKIAVMEGLLKTIAFPFAVNSRLNYLLENEDYNMAFDTEKLEQSKNNFDKICHEVSKIVATCV